MCPPQDESELSQADILADQAASCVPKDEVSQAAFKHAATHLHPLILDHSMRVFFLSRHLSETERAPWHQGVRLPILFTACLFHDIGTSSTYDTGPKRFEIEGADAARIFLLSYNISKEDLDEVWKAIALHDTPQVAEQFPGPGLVRLVRLGVLADFKRKHALQLFKSEDVLKWEAKFPRGKIEKVLGDAVVEQAVKCPEKAPLACWPGGLYRAHLEDPEWAGVNKAF